MERGKVRADSERKRARKEPEVFPARCISHINDFGHGVTALDIQWHLVGRPYNGTLETSRWSPWNKLKGGWEKIDGVATTPD